MHVYRKGPLEVTGLTACLEDEDWIPAYSDCCLSDPSGAVVRWDPSVGPLEVDLVDSKGVVLPPSGPNDINERRPGEARLLRAKHRGGVFLVRIRASGAVSVPYSIDLYAPVLVDQVTSACGPGGGCAGRTPSAPPPGSVLTGPEAPPRRHWPQLEPDSSRLG